MELISSSPLKSKGDWGTSYQIWGEALTHTGTWTSNRKIASCQISLVEYPGRQLTMKRHGLISNFRNLGRRDIEERRTYVENEIEIAFHCYKAAEVVIDGNVDSKDRWTHDSQLIPYEGNYQAIAQEIHRIMTEMTQAGSGRRDMCITLIMIIHRLSRELQRVRERYITA